MAEMPPLYGSDPQAVAEELAASAWGLEAVEAEPNLIDVAMLGLLGRHQLVVHQLHGAASQHAAVVDLHALPDTPPALLRQPWLLEVRHSDEGARLFGDTLSLSGYTLDGTSYLLGLLGDGNAIVAPWQPRWTGEDLAEGTHQERSPLIDEGHAPAHAAWAREAARYAVVFDLLAEAEGTPLRIEDGRQRDARAGLPVRNVYLDGAVSAPLESPPEAGSTGRDAVARQVRGHLKRQRHGPGLSLSRWIYVSQYAAWRWVRLAS
ncbi:hypothetical protein [Corallococcus exiguus]|uniref:hypothetical protein n=1 Tax=Corallococcus exiguus TaxID=83462 RepID=UPI001472361F|nr:hypothetical protein [Corallococcus exiguus]NNB89657.1 hypothetical protein [Corallococcus exiguus]